MKKIASILLILFSFALLSAQNVEQYQYKHGKPVSKGIDYYVKKNVDNFVNEYQAFIKDTLYNYYISTADFRDYADYDSLELGRFYIPDEIVINNEEEYYDYDIKYLSRFKRRIINEYNIFVKGVAMHELTHDYFYQIILEMRMDTTVHVDIAYNNFRIYPNEESRFTSEFIEEGVCNYVMIKMQESVPYEKYILTDINDIINKKKIYNVKYQYSYFYLQNFLDNTIQQYGRIKEGIEILLANKPPTYEELLTPNLFFNRLH